MKNQCKSLNLVADRLGISIGHRRLLQVQSLKDYKERTHVNQHSEHVV